ncbi:MAG TPA: hypothetical protein VMT35_09435 [Ignavibacteriaceae bacterium]|nr:hypothetical protein [Ignavibacteriaceae bacterium]
MYGINFFPGGLEKAFFLYEKKFHLHFCIGTDGRGFRHTTTVFRTLVYMKAKKENLSPNHTLRILIAEDNVVNK